MEKQIDGDALLIQAYEALGMVQGVLATLKREVMRLQVENQKLIEHALNHSEKTPSSVTD